MKIENIFLYSFILLFFYSFIFNIIAFIFHDIENDCLAVIFATILSMNALIPSMGIVLIF